MYQATAVDGGSGELKGDNEELERNAASTLVDLSMPKCSSADSRDTSVQSIKRIRVRGKRRRRRGGCGMRVVSGEELLVDNEVLVVGGRRVCERRECGRGCGRRAVEGYKSVENEVNGCVSGDKIKESWSGGEVRECMSGGEVNGNKMGVYTRIKELPVLRGQMVEGEVGGEDEEKKKKMDGVDALLGLCEEVRVVV